MENSAVSDGSSQPDISAIISEPVGSTIATPCGNVSEHLWLLNFCFGLSTFLCLQSHSFCLRLLCALSVKDENLLDEL